MSSLVLEKDPVAVKVTMIADKFVVDLEDGRGLAVPLAWYPRLLHGSEVERRNCEILGDGYAIEWPDLDEHIGVEGLLAGHRSGESESSLNQWLRRRSNECQPEN
jgi:hypothetical protein